MYSSCDTGYDVFGGTRRNMMDSNWKLSEDNFENQMNI